MSKTKLELLSPAKDLETGMAAINCGADAIYIGAPKFGARSAAGNSLQDIQSLVNYAHKYWAKVYVTINTIIYNDELDEVQKLISTLYEIGTDAIIFQDMSLLEMSLPPIQLFASTQTHNYEIERIKFLDELGIKRIILARELSLDQIKEIKAGVKADLEFFVHGALCVSLSGQCYMSAELSGRSANRGECAQNCRLPYSLIDANGEVLIKDKHLLSLRDLNLSEYLNDLVGAGITSFKIEGRLKDASYVKNITAFYRQKLDDLIKNNSMYEHASSGYSTIPFEPDPERTFSRGYTTYFINDRSEPVSSHNTPKSTGKYLGKVTEVKKNGFVIGTTEKIVNGDGLCFYADNGELAGMYVNEVNDQMIFTNDLPEIKPGKKIYRNFDHAFEKELGHDCKRKISVRLTVEETDTGINISAVDGDNVCTEHTFVLQKEKAANAQQAILTFKKQLSKSGETIFDITDIDLKFDSALFIPVKHLNEMRRTILDKLESNRIELHMTNIPRFERIHSEISIRQTKIAFNYNVVNKLSEQFYKNHGATEIEPGFEIQNNHGGKTVMTCKYCIKDELGLCPFDTNEKVNEPLYLVGSSRKYELVFNCKDCLMEIVAP